MEEKYVVIISDYPLDEIKGKTIANYNNLGDYTRELNFEEMVKALFIACVSNIVDYAVIKLGKDNYVLTDEDEDKIYNDNKKLVNFIKKDIVKTNCEENLNFIEIFYKLYVENQE